MASASHLQVIIYTTPTCPDCGTLTAHLAREEGVAFGKRDLSNPEITPPMVEAAMQLCTARGLRSEDIHADVFFTSGEV